MGPPWAGGVITHGFLLGWFSTQPAEQSPDGHAPFSWRREYGLLLRGLPALLRRRLDRGRTLHLQRQYGRIGSLEGGDPPPTEPPDGGPPPAPRIAGAKAGAKLTLDQLANMTPAQMIEAGYDQTGKK